MACYVYADIICRTDDFRDLFKPHFANVETVRGSFRHLQPVRVAAMHAREISKDDLVLVALESKRLMEGMARKIDGSTKA